MLGKPADALHDALIACVPAVALAPTACPAGCAAFAKLATEGCVRELVAALAEGGAALGAAVKAGSRYPRSCWPTCRRARTSSPRP
jgi:hypothetical protein